MCLSDAKAVVSHHEPIDEGRKLGDRRWLDTVVVLTINDTDIELDMKPLCRSLQN